MERALSVAPLGTRTSSGAGTARGAGAARMRERGARRRRRWRRRWGVRILGLVWVGGWVVVVGLGDCLAGCFVVGACGLWGGFVL